MYKVYACLSFFHLLRLRMRSHTKSPTVKASSGAINHMKTSRSLWNVVFLLKCPAGSWSSGAFSWYSSGRLEELHLFITTPFFSNTSPGLERIMVFSMISSATAKGYSAPVFSFH